ncbi:hypothetical protein M5689_002628 [Euphorbia peplus]|nr:hypothetical protein M5689_002628 [Euphorbia peplus]
MSSSMGKITVKAMVDKEKNKVIFAECDEDFADVLCSFLTIPMGTIVSLQDKDNLPARIGCMSNLYTSVQNLDVKYFRTQACQKMLLHPRNGAPSKCARLKINLDDIDAHTYFCCSNGTCRYVRILYDLNYYKTCCACGSSSDMQLVRVAAESKSNDPVEAAVFLKGLNRLVISDYLQLMHPTTSSSFPLLSVLSVTESTISAFEVREFSIGEDQVIKLLKSSLVSKEPLTLTLLQKNELYKESLLRGSSCSSFEGNYQIGEENGKICVKLFISKSTNMVCFAEVGEDFVDLMFSFLTIPLGHVLKQMQGASIEGCVDTMYKSIEDLDVEIFKSSSEKQMLLNPKVAPNFGYDNQITGIEEVSCDAYFDKGSKLATKVRDPRIPTHKEDKSNGGFMAGPAMFTVTDNLNVIPISAVSGVNILNRLHVPLSDVDERFMYVGNKEAVRLLVASFGSESALTHTFLQN